MESERIKDEYAAREAKQRDSIYGILQRSNQLTVHGIERALFKALACTGWSELASRKFLDVGCGTGGLLLRWIQWGAMPENCHGIELVPQRLEQARRRLPASVQLTIGDASRLPFPDHTFDLTSQLTVLSSILDDGMQQAVAAEMLRVTKPKGFLVSYDFWLNPTNPATRGVKVARLRELFPGCRIHVQRVTLAPPIARRLAPLSPLLYRSVESLKFLNSHYLVMIKPAAHS